jgi:NADH-quinone oxidoreductase subunit C
MSDFISKNPLLRTLTEHFDSVVEPIETLRDETEIRVEASNLIDVVRFLRDDASLAFDMLTDLTIVDYLGKRDVRFELVCHFYSLGQNHRLRLVCAVSEEKAELPTLSGLYLAADWFEREAFDMYGIRFSDHPDLRRILLYDSFKGHPLRKDYAVKASHPLIELKDPSELSRFHGEDF